MSKDKLVVGKVEQLTQIKNIAREQVGGSGVGMEEYVELHIQATIDTILQLIDEEIEELNEYKGRSMPRIRYKRIALSQLKQKIQALGDKE